ncbi:hydrolase [Moraxella caviae]|nr:Cof-type HAD-IIB family hydrolase [Moraxella caviae]OOR93522.1 hydrolase [Moraxella caviae]
MQILSHTTPPLAHAPKIVFFDIDDTLYIKYDNYVPPSVTTALLALKERGIMVAIATGRGICVFPPAINELIDKVGIDLFVTINGQYNEFRGEPLVDFALTSEQIRTTTDLLKRKNLAYGYMTRDAILAFDETPAMTAALTSLHIPYRVVDSFDMTTPVYQMLTFYDDNSTIDLDLPSDLKTVRWHVSGVDILDAKGSKARGIQAVLDALGLDFSEAMAFGDGLNDLEMLQAVGTGVAMGNAHPNLKAVADYVCPNHTDDGIYQGLKMLGVID